jgi:hypothetical protein
MKRCTRVGQIKRGQVRFSGRFGFELPESTKNSICTVNAPQKESAQYLELCWVPSLGVLNLLTVEYDIGWLSRNVCEELPTACCVNSPCS